MPGEKIMVVDDEPGMRSLLSKVLAKSGYFVNALEKGEDALDSIRTLDHLEPGGYYYFAPLASLMPEFAFPYPYLPNLTPYFFPWLRKAGRQVLLKVLR